MRLHLLHNLQFSIQVIDINIEGILYRQGTEYGCYLQVCFLPPSPSLSSPSLLHFSLLHFFSLSLSLSLPQSFSLSITHTLSLSLSQSFSLSIAHKHSTFFFCINTYL